jgi:hypothetical protein
VRAHGGGTTGADLLDGTRDFMLRDMISKDELGIRVSCNVLTSTSPATQCTTSCATISKAEA